MLKVTLDQTITVYCVLCCTLCCLYFMEDIILCIHGFYNTELKLKHVSLERDGCAAESNSCGYVICAPSIHLPSDSLCCKHFSWLHLLQHYIHSKHSFNLYRQHTEKYFHLTLQSGLVILCPMHYMIAASGEQWDAELEKNLKYIWLA